ncbi:MAG: sulfur oxidation c-type cytochrome SoxX [Pseudomonadota bacterium]|jgi:sulfur-oxidizing protein SoxX
MPGMRAWPSLVVLALSGVVHPMPAWAEDAAAERGKALLLRHQESGCVLCHRIPGLASRAELGPDLAGVASRMAATDLFDRIADARTLNPNTIMPPTLSNQHLRQIAPEWQGKTLLVPAQVHDIVAYLMAYAR